MYTLEEIDRILENSSKLSLVNREPANLYDPIGYMMEIGGKRIRPKLCLLTYNLLKNEMNSSILFPAMALEVFHEFTLIHDDIMDRSDTRRGNPTVYKKWNENVAILSGDVMSILAYNYLAYAPTDVLPQVLNLFTDTATQICEGQQYDMDFEDLAFITMDDYLSMIGLKTAVLLACSAKMGALIGGASKEVCDALYRFGYELGMAFQITDDYLDTFGNEKVFGKKIGGDIINNKKTWLLVESLRRADGERRLALQQMMQIGQIDPAAKIEVVRNLYVEIGVKEAAENEILVYRQKAMDALEATGIAPERTRYLVEFAEKLIHREK